MQRLAECALHVGLELGIERGAARVEEARPRRDERLPGAARVVEEARVHRRHARHDAHALDRERRGESFGREARDEMQRRAGEQRAQRDGGEAEHVRDRQCRVHPVARPNPSKCRAGACREQQVRVRQHDALRRAGRAGGVDQRADAFRGVVVNRLGNGRLVAGGDADCTEAGQRERLTAEPRRVRRRLRRHLHSAERPPRHAVAADRLDLARRQPGVYGHRPCAATARRQCEDDRRSAVLVHDQNPIPGPHAQAGEECCGRRDRLRQLPVVERPAGLDQGRGIPEGFRAARRELVDPARRIAAPGRGRDQGASATSRLQGA